MQGGPIYGQVAPSSIISSNNRTGAVTVVDEAVFTPDSSYMTPTNVALEWDVRLGFPTPAVAPIAGIGKSILVLRVVLGGTPNKFYPKCSVSIYQNTTLFATLGYRAVADPLGQLFIFPWNALGILTSGSNLRAQIDFEPGDNGSYAKLELARLYFESSSVSDDTGWLPSTSGSSIDEESGAPPTLSLQHFPLVSWTGVTQLSFMFLDDQVDHDPDLGGTLVSVPTDNVIKAVAPGYIEAGVAVIGVAIQTQIGVPNSEPPRVGIHTESVNGRTLGGQSYGAVLYSFRTASFTLILTEDEANRFMAEIPWRKGVSGAFYLSLEPDADAANQTFTSFWCTLSEDVNDLQNFGNVDTRRISISVEEKL
jgi:hypothetical protein